MQVLADIMHDSEGGGTAAGGAAEALLPQVKAVSGFCFGSTLLCCSQMSSNM